MWFRKMHLSLRRADASSWSIARIGKEMIPETPRKYTFLLCGNLDFELAVIAQNDELKGSFYSSYATLLNAKT